MLVAGSEDGTPQSIQDRVLDETHPVGTQLDSPPSDVPAASKRDLGAGPLRPVFDLTVDDSDGTNVGQECDAVPHVSSVCRGRFAVAEEDTVEQGVSPVSGSSFRHQNHDARQIIPPSGDSAPTVMDRCLSGRGGILRNSRRLILLSQSQPVAQSSGVDSHEAMLQRVRVRIRA